MFTNIKCAITTAILSVLIFILLLECLGWLHNKLTTKTGISAQTAQPAQTAQTAQPAQPAQTVTSAQSGGQSSINPYKTLMDDTKPMYESIEMVMLVSVFLAFNVNTFLFNYCSTWKM